VLLLLKVLSKSEYDWGLARRGIQIQMYKVPDLESEIKWVKPYDADQQLTVKIECSGQRRLWVRIKRPGGKQK
jgi:hypothetical protein